MGRDKSLGANPVELHRKRMQEREAKRNKEVRKKTQEAAIMHKDTSKIERKISQYKEIMQRRKLTALEREKLQNMEKEVEEIREKQQKAGVAPKEHGCQDGPIIGYDPMAQADGGTMVIGGIYGSSSDSDSDDGGGSAAAQAEIDGLDIPTIAVVKESTSQNAAGMLPMPPGTPPLSPKELGVGVVWPPLPPGPSPLFLKNNPQALKPRGYAHGASERGRERGRGRGGYRLQQPYGRHAPPRPPPPRPPFALPSAAGAGQPMPHIRPPPPPPPPPRPIRPVSASATVLAAEPQVRDLKKELTALVPAAISRKSKQKERERVLSSVPAVPKMVVNAAPEIGPETDTGGARKDSSSGSGSAATLLGSFKPHSGVRFTSGKVELRDQSAQKEKERKAAPFSDVAAKDSLDDEYQKFLKQMDNLM
ncbi:hypothetical protein LPJ75_000695 [Coemansia sp. RSA 2598]|nr:hypothetical protein LPJ75_000695 [Coemansia sp. RSA 2598]